MSPIIDDRDMQARSVPRASGDEPGQLMQRIHAIMCSPRERG